MKPTELLKLIERNMLPESGPGDVRTMLEDAGINYTFSAGFTERVIDKVFAQAIVVNRQLDFVRSLNNTFYRVAFAGVAAIIILLVSIFIMEGSLTLNSLVGISESVDENLVSLLTAN